MGQQLWQSASSNAHAIKLLWNAYNNDKSIIVLC